MGQLYIEEAPNIPERNSSPFLGFVKERMMAILVTLKAHAIAHQQFDTDALMPESRRLLAEAQQDLATRVARNVLYHE